ncbi:MAG TPA: ribosome maturation factor RimM [Puia sp.]|nr:ribosome maturation factor RimM [Puia sp.]
MSEYRNIGKFVATHGYRGDVVLEHHLGKKTSLKNLEMFFINTSVDEMFPYFIQHTKIKSDSEITVKIEGIDSKEAAEKILKREVWINEADFKKYAHSSAPASLVNFHLINEGDDLGEIKEVIELPHQLLCRIYVNNKEALIPLHDETLKKIDKKNKQVHVKLPEGLLDIYR